MEITASPDIRRMPIFSTLVAKRRKVVIGLTAATLIPYYAFILVAAYTPWLLAFRFDAGSVVTTGWIIGILLIVGTWLLTGVYVFYANGEFDQLIKNLKAGIES